MKKIEESIFNKSHHKVFRQNTELENQMIEDWLKHNTPKKVGLDISIEEFSKKVEKTIREVNPYEN